MVTLLPLLFLRVGSGASSESLLDVSSLMPVDGSRRHDLGGEGTGPGPRPRSEVEPEGCPWVGDEAARLAASAACEAGPGPAVAVVLVLLFGAAAGAGGGIEGMPLGGEEVAGEAVNGSALNMLSGLRLLSEPLRPSRLGKRGIWDEGKR